jgi:hypothetical protein
MHLEHFMARLHLHSPFICVRPHQGLFVMLVACLLIYPSELLISAPMFWFVGKLLNAHFILLLCLWGSVQSLSLAALGPSRRANAIADVAYNPVEIKARLVGVNVYTVANKKNEFVLVSGVAGVSWAPHHLCTLLALQ